MADKQKEKYEKERDDFIAAHGTLTQKQEALEKARKDAALVIQEASALVQQIALAKPASIEEKLKVKHTSEDAMLNAFKKAKEAELKAKHDYQKSAFMALVWGNLKTLKEQARVDLEKEKWSLLKKDVEAKFDEDDDDADDPIELEMLVVSQDDVEINRTDPEAKVGEGAFGVVWKGTCKGMEVAVKELKATKLDEAGRTNFLSECKFLSHLQNEYVLQFVGVCLPSAEQAKLETANYALITEFSPNKSLAHYVKKPVKGDNSKQFSLIEKVRLLREICAGMAYLAGKGVAHNDLKPANILLDENFHVRIADFGLSKIVAKDPSALAGTMASPAGGTPLYMAPEILPEGGGTPGEASDMYSFGILAWETLFQQGPYEGEKERDVRKSIKNLVEHVRTKNSRPEVPANKPPIKSFLQKCWIKDSSERYKFSELNCEAEADPWLSIISTAISDEKELHHNIWSESTKVSAGKKPSLAGTNKALFTILLANLSAMCEVDNVAKNVTLTKCIAAVLGIDYVDNKDDAEITLEMWDRLIVWFGPFESDPHNKLSVLMELVKEPWFHGAMSEMEAVDKLAYEVAGTFLVRFSSKAGHFTISWVQPVDKKKAILEVVHERFTSKAENVIAHVRKMQKDKKTKNLIKTPAPDRPSKFIEIFPPKAKQ